MKYLINLSLAMLIVFASQTFAQKVEPNIAFDKTTHNFGKIKETDGAVKYNFEFTNTGSQPLIITDVSASCGCTTPEWSREPIPAGGRGFVSALYDPKNRPGNFNKTVTVKSNSENSPIMLHITGDVGAKEPSVEEAYRYPMDGVRLDASNVHFAEIFSDETLTEDINFINTSEQDVKVTFNENRGMPSHISISSVPETVKPGEKGKIIVVFDAAKKNDWDYVYDRIYVSTNGAYNPNNRLVISAIIKERFTAEQLKNPPAIEFTTAKEYDFGTVKQGEKIEYEFKFKNTGKSDLIIRKTKASCGCTAIAPQDRVVKPGQESSIKAVFNTMGKRGTQTKTITVITNIPGKVNGQDLSRHVLVFKGNVEAE